MDASERYDNSPVHTLPDGRTIPPEFDVDDAEMAELFNHLFCVQQEELPPYYTQSLLGHAGTSNLVATEDFEERMTTQVFDRLGIQRPTQIATPPATPVALAASPAPRHFASLVRSGALVLVAIVALAGCTATISGRALADALRYLFVGNSGTQLVNSFPKVVQPPTTLAKDSPGYGLAFTPQYAGPALDNFAFVSMDVYPAENWSNGAITMLNYVRQDETGIHHLSVLEFVPSAVYALQVVQTGSAQTIPVGNGSGVYVYGQWMHYKHGQVWLTGAREELIYTRPDQSGLVTWIATDLADGSGAAQRLLVDVALNLKTYDYARDLSNRASAVRFLTGDMLASRNSLFSTDLIVLINNAAATSATTISIFGNPPTSASDTSTGQQGQP